MSLFVKRDILIRHDIVQQTCATVSVNYHAVRSHNAMEDLANVALQQINDRAYSVDLQAMNVTSIIKIGIAFSGKRTRIAAERQNIE